MHLGPYQLLDELGRGGTGVVYRARSPRGDEVAIKLLGRRDPDALARFDRERRMTDVFNVAEGFVPLLDAGQAPQGSYLVMPLMTGGTLRDRLRRGPLDLDQTLALGKTLAHAVARAHGRGIVHRDLKPENVLFDSHEVPLIADLGLAKHFSNQAPGASMSQSLSRDGGLRGTAGYMSPEQAADAKSVGPPSDVFALGAILYECLSGRAAFTGDTVIDVLTRVIDARFEPLERSVPRWVATVIEKALAKEPARRFADATALARALDEARPPRRSVVAPVIVLVLLISAALAGWQVFKARRVRETVVKARTALVAKDPTQALRLADEALALDPTCAAAWCLRGDARRETKDYKGAVADLTRALELDPQDAVAWVARGDARSELDELDQAIADTTRAIELAPGLARAWKERGVARTMKHELPAALADLDRALELDPSGARTYQNRAYARQLSNDHPGALADATKAIELEPQLARNWVIRATSRIALGDRDGGIADCEKALALSPNEGHAYALRGLARAQKGDEAGGLVDLDRGLALDPSLPTDWMNRAGIRYRLRDFDGAIADFNKTLAMNPKLTTVYLRRSYVRQSMGDFDAAIADLERYLELNPSDPDAADHRKRLEDMRARRGH